MALPDPEVIRKEIIMIRRGTETREAIKITVTQKQRRESGELLTPTIELTGFVPNLIESGRFAQDVANALTVAAYFFNEWSHYVTGKR